MNPLTGLYGAATALRNTLFDRGVLPSRRLERPVVSVGNLSAGGSGKTPFVIALGELLKARGIRFDVLSRGYGRKTRGVLVVETGGNAADFGDEPLLIARRLGVPVIVGESRYEAGRVAEQKFQPQLHILDDGFQHRSLARDFDIVLMTERDFDDRLLPSGRLREPLSSLATRRRNRAARRLGGGSSGAAAKADLANRARTRSPEPAFRAGCLLRHRATRTVLRAGTRRRNHACGRSHLSRPPCLRPKTTSSPCRRMRDKLQRRRVPDNGKRCDQPGTLSSAASNHLPSPSSGSRSTVPLTLWMSFWRESGKRKPRS